VFEVAGVLNMWIEKLLDGVLCVRTPLGPRYVRPSFLQRAYLLWIFRNFQVLPAKVLTLRQQMRIENMLAEHGFISVLGPNGATDVPILGTLEQRPPVERHRPKDDASVPVSPFATDQQQT
jgi:hypothetical protein